MNTTLAMGTTPHASARLVSWAPGRFLALAPHATLEIVERPQAIAVPGQAPHALGLLAWHRRHVPLVDLRTVLDPGGPRAAAAFPYALVVVGRDTPGAPATFAALALRELPETVRVRDGDACALPDGRTPWHRIAVSCFTHGGDAVPVVDVPRLLALLRAP